jgi:hypothetical protein
MKNKGTQKPVPQENNVKWDEEKIVHQESLEELQKIQDLEDIPIRLPTKIWSLKNYFVHLG